MVIGIGIGTIGRALGFDIGQTANNVVSKLFGNSIAGQGFGAIAGGLASGLTGDPVGVLQQGMKMFQSIAQGLGSLFKPQQGHLGGMGGFPQMPMAPQMMGGMMPGAGMMGVPGGFSSAGGNSTLNAAGSALGQMGNLRGQMENLMNRTDLSPEQKQYEMMKLQQEMQTMQQMLQMISTISKKQHDISMSIIGNMR
jgi:hypothetical protein